MPVDIDGPDRILVVDDDESICLLVRAAFQKEGYSVRMCTRGNEAIEAVKEYRPHLLLLDLNLPGADGRDLCREIREDADTRSLPILMMTSLGEEEDRVLGFEVGTDDYLAKPFSYRELVLRSKALLRRSRPAAPREGPKVVADGPIRLEMDRRELFLEGEPVEVTSTEFRLLAYLMLRSGRVISRAELLEEVWGTKGDLTTRRVDTYVQRLRSKLGDEGSRLHTHRGHGYRFE